MGPVWRLVAVEGERIWGKDEGGVMWWKFYVLMNDGGYEFD
jgi:hypothetical protein